MVQALNSDKWLDGQLLKSQGSKLQSFLLMRSKRAWISIPPERCYHKIILVSGIIFPPSNTSSFFRTLGKVSRASAAKGESAAAT